MTTRKMLLAAGAALLIAGPVLAQVPIGSLDSRGITIQGTVTDVFGNRVILQDQSGRTLVDLGPPHASTLRVTPGERLTVVGEPRENGFRARLVTREDGTTTTIERGPPPKSERAGPRPERRAEDRVPGPRMEPVRASEQEIRQRLASLGYSDIREVERKRAGFEVEGRNPRGERVELQLDRDGNIVRERWKR